MTIPSNPSELFSPFLPTTYNIPEEDDRLRTFLVDRFSTMSDVVNDKRIGNYAQAAENFNGTKWAFGSTKIVRNGYQAIAYIPSLPNATTLIIDLTTTPTYPVPNVNDEFIITHCWGSASRPCTETGAGDGDYFSFYSEGNSKITFTMSDTMITLISTVDLSEYIGIIVVEYIRNGT